MSIWAVGPAPVPCDMTTSGNFLPFAPAAFASTKPAGRQMTRAVRWPGAPIATCSTAKAGAAWLTAGALAGVPLNGSTRQARLAAAWKAFIDSSSRRPMAKGPVCGTRTLSNKLRFGRCPEQAERQGNKDTESHQCVRRAVPSLTDLRWPRAGQWSVRRAPSAAAWGCGTEPTRPGGNHSRQPSEAHGHSGCD